MERRERIKTGLTLLRLLALAEQSLLLPALPEANGGRHTSAAITLYAVERGLIDPDL